MRQYLAVVAPPSTLGVRSVVQPPSYADVPYEIHTNRELEFMLNRGKPLAHFCDGYPPEPDEDIIPRRAFAPHVVSGLIVERLYVEISGRNYASAEMRGLLHALYAKHDEAWRINRYIEMQAEGAKLGWSEHLERLQGSLLGYTEQENDLHIARALKNPAPRGWPWVKAALASRGMG